MNRWIFVLILTLLLAGVQGCAGVGDGVVVGSGDVGSETRSVKDFSRINFSAPGTLVVKNGKKEGLKIEAEKNLLPLLETELVGETLNILVQDDQELRPNKPIKFTLTVNRLTTVEVSGSGDATLPDMSGEHITLVVTGSGDLEAGDLKADLVTIEIDGAGKITTGKIDSDWTKLFSRGSGRMKVERVEGRIVETVSSGSGDVNIVGGEVLGQGVNTSGSGEYLAATLSSSDVEAELSGDGSAKVRVKNTLKVTLSGSGNLLYFGEPTVDKRTVGSGRVIAQDSI